MFKNKKQGFSLIEVMILFTLLAVILAASMPILTKKSNPIPRRVPHGVYRCYANQEGNIIEELYNANGLVDTKNLGQAQCRFTVPTASVYTIELYGAGAGGTKYAEMTPTLSQDEDREFTLANAVDYEKSGDEKKYINPQGSGYKLTDRVIQDAFKGQKVIISAFSQNAGKGGTAKAVFYSPSNIRCNNSSLSNIPINDLIIKPFENKFSYNDKDIVPVKTKDSSNKNYDHFQTQIDWYCKLASMDEYTQRQPLYNSTGWKSVTLWMSQAPDGLTCDDSGKGCFHYVGSPREVVENGGFGGLGTFSNLSYTLPESPIVPSSRESFPYVISIGSIFGNTQDDYGFYTASCNNNGACTREVIPTRGEDGNNDTEGAKHIDFTSAILNTYPVEGKLLKADNGGPVERRLAWQRADNQKFMFGNKLPASGGKGGTIQVTSSTAGLPTLNNVNAVINLLNRNYLWTLNANSDNLDGVNAEGVDTPNGTNSHGINFSISASNKGISQTPSISIKSKMLEKHYKLGKPGSYGQKRTFKVSTLGKSCTLHVAQGGKPLNYVNLLSNNKTQDEIKGIAREMESELNTSIRCTDGNDLTFQDSAEGGKYNLSLYEPAPFVWKNGDELGKEYTVSSDDAAEKPNNPIDSIFGHAYKKLFSKLYVSDIIPLTNYNISYGGAGSTLSDSCTVPKGITKIDLVTTKITRTLNTDKNSNNYGEITEEESSSNKNIKNDKNDGKREYRDCYVTNYGPIVDLIKEDNLHSKVNEKLLFTDDFLNNKYYNKKFYTLNAGPGGGGAIVITW